MLENVDVMQNREYEIIAEQAGFAGGKPVRCFDPLQNGALVVIRSCCVVPHRHHCKKSQVFEGMSNSGPINIDESADSTAIHNHVAEMKVAVNECQTFAAQIGNRRFQVLNRVSYASQDSLRQRLLDCGQLCFDVDDEEASLIIVKSALRGAMRRPERAGAGFDISIGCLVTISPRTDHFTLDAGEERP